MLLPEFILFAKISNTFKRTFYKKLTNLHLYLHSSMKDRNTNMYNGKNPNTT